LARESDLDRAIYKQYGASLALDPAAFRLARPWWLGPSSPPIMGFAAQKYTEVTPSARARAPRDGRLIVGCTTVLGAIGAVAVWFPQLPGNGKRPVQRGLGGDLTVALAAALLVLKIAATTGRLRAGAEGGLLTPALTIGALQSVLGHCRVRHSPARPNPRSGT